MRAIWFVALMLLLAPSATLAAASPDQFAGDWSGSLSVGGGQSLRFTLHLVNTQGAWSGTAESPDQGGGAMTVSKVSVDGTKLSFEIPEVDGEYEGTLDKDGKTIMGTWWQHGAALTLNFTRGDDSPRTPPAPPSGFAATLRGEFAGDWAGTLDAGMKLRIALHLLNTNGVWSGTMDSLDQGANGIPFTNVTGDGAKIHVEIKSINGSYEGTLGENGDTIKGTWSQGGMSLPLDLTRGDAKSLAGANRPQEPKPPLPYRAEDVTVPGPGGIMLAGTFTAPTGNGPFPAVLLITGSGPENRDETVFGHRPFLVLSDHLTRNGIAVLRLDDRGVGKSTGSFTGSTTEDFAKDAESAVAFLKSRKDVNAKKIGLVGHSEGGIIAPIVAARSKDVAFVVMMAGVGVPAGDLLVRQSSDIMRASGQSEEAIKYNAAAVRRMCQIVTSETDTTVMHQKLDAVADSLTAQLGALEPSKAAIVKEQVRASTTMISTPWFRYLLALKPEETLRKVKQPVLAINGSLDLQVSSKDNLPAIEKALRAGGNKDVTVKELPGLNHLFQTATTGSPMEYSTIEETMSPLAMKTISDWIVARTSPKKK